MQKLPPFLAPNPPQGCHPYATSIARPRKVYIFTKWWLLRGEIRSGDY